MGKNDCYQVENSPHMGFCSTRNPHLLHQVRSACRSHTDSSSAGSAYTFSNSKVRRIAYILQRRDPNDISVSMVPETHDLIPPQKLGAEASGLLDRILGVFHESAE